MAECGFHSTDLIKNQPISRKIDLLESNQDLLIKLILNFFQKTQNKTLD